MAKTIVLADNEHTIEVTNDCLYDVLAKLFNIQANGIYPFLAYC